VLDRSASKLHDEYPLVDIWLRPGEPRDRYFLATKVGRYGDAEFDFSAKRSAASIDESLQRLGIDYVDIIQSHDNEYGDLNQVVNETIPALRQIQKQGKARFVGITGYPLKIFDTILSSTEVDTILSYNHYSLNDTTLAGLLPWLREKGVESSMRRQSLKVCSQIMSCLPGIPLPRTYEKLAQTPQHTVAAIERILPNLLCSFP